MSKTIMDEEDAGYVDGLKKAYELVGKLAEFYDKQKEITNEDKQLSNLQAQVNACRYAQFVIRKGEWKDGEELPW